MRPSIDLLGNHRDLVSMVARWHWDEWGADYEDSSLEEWTAQLAGKTRTDGLPCSWIAFVDADPVGSVVLELDGVEPRPDLKPDLGGLYVLPEYRTRGIGSALVLACEAGARDFGVRDLYLYTEKRRDPLRSPRLGHDRARSLSRTARCDHAEVAVSRTYERLTPRHSPR